MSKEKNDGTGSKNLGSSTKSTSGNQHAEAAAKGKSSANRAMDAVKVSGGKASKGSRRNEDVNNSSGSADQ